MLYFDELCSVDVINAACLDFADNVKKIFGEARFEMVKADTVRLTNDVIHQNCNMAYMREFERVQSIFRKVNLCQ